MKKITAIILAMIMLIGSGTIAVSADGESYMNKLDANLIEELNSPTDVMIEVVIFLKDCPAKWHIDELVSQKYTWTNEQEHLMYYRREVAAVIGAYVRQFIDDNADLLYEIICQIDSAEFIIATVAKENIPALAVQDIVSDISLYLDVPAEPDIEPDEPVILEPDIPGMIPQAANELYYDPRHTITAQDIILKDYYGFHDGSACAVYFYVKDMEYTAQMIEERIGGWLLVSSDPAPLLFVNNKLYGFKDAYDEGLMTDSMLRELAAVSFPCFSRRAFLTRYIKGDADGDGDVSIVDATVIQRYDVDMIDEYGLYKPLADADGDGDVTVVDATVIQRFEAGIIDIL